MKIKGSTLIEVLIAMVIIGFVFTIGTAIYINLHQAVSNYHEWRIELALKKYAVQTKREASFFDEEIEESQMSLQKAVETDKGLVKIHYSAWIKELEIVSFDEIIYVAE